MLLLAKYLYMFSTKYFDQIKEMCCKPAFRGSSPVESFNLNEEPCSRIAFYRISFYINTMDERIMVNKYEETAKIFEQLPGMFLVGEVPSLLQHYEACIYQIKELIPMENDPMLLESLESILAQIEWQQERVQDAYNSSVNQKQLQKVTQEKSPFQEAKLQEKKGSDKKADYRQEVIKLTHQSVSGNGLSDVIGLQDVKALLKKSVLLPMLYPSLFTGGRKPWTQILLYGPPGTGKSKIAQALAVESRAQFYSVSSADLLSSWVGESEKMIKDLFEFTRTNKEKSILFIDEIDSICRKRSTKEGDHSRSIKNQLLIELDRNSACENNCFILCATNCPWDIDVAFLRRFQCRIYVPLPDSSTRIEIIRKTCEGVNISLNSDELKIISERTDGYSGADLVHLTNYALQEPLGELDDNQTWISQNDKWIPCTSNTPRSVKIPFSLIPPEKIGVRNVLLKDFIKAIKLVPKTVSKEELEKYNEYSKPI